MRKSLLVWFCLLCMTVCRSQNKEFMEDQFAKFSRKLPIESVYLHIDRSKFSTGDTIWWKAYLFAGDGGPAISTNLTVEFFSDSGKLISRRLAPILRSSSAGQIALPDSLRSGRYFVRAYTRYQTNFDSTRYFMAPVAVYNPNDPKEIPVALRRDPEPEPKTTTVDKLFWVSSVNAGVLSCLLETDSTGKYLDKPLTVVVMSYHQPFCRASLKLTLARPWHDFTLPCKDLDGYVDLLLWADSQLIARQSLFIRQKEMAAVAVTPDTLSGIPHGYNSWKVHIDDSLLYNCSVSVTDADRTDESPLHIEYALTPDPLNYHDLLNGKYPEIKVIDTNYLSWDGAVADGVKRKKKKFKQAELVTLISSPALPLPETRLLPLDTAGRFTLNRMFFFDKALMNFQLNHTSGESSRELRMQLMDNFRMPLFKKPVSMQWEDSVLTPEELAHAEGGGRISIHAPPFPKAKLLDTVMVRGRKDVRQELDNKYTTGVFSEPTLFSFDVRNEKNYFNLQDYLRANIPGFECYPPADTPSFKKRPVIFYLDEELADWEILRSYRISDMAYVKTFMDQHWFGDSPFMRWKTGYKGAMMKPVGGGSDDKNKLKLPVDEDPLIVCIYLKKGIDIRTGSPDLNSIALDGYTPISHFERAAENGLTLFWSPLELKNDFRVQFENNGISRRFRICIEGINGYGRVVHYEKTITADMIGEGETKPLAVIPPPNLVQ